MEAGKIADTHAHYDDPAFDRDRDELLRRLFAGPVELIVNQGTTLATSEESVRLSERYPGMYAAVGLHPECVGENSLEELERLLPLYDCPKTVAVGEIGLDYYYDNPRDLQKAVFCAQLDLAKEKNLPVTIHDREAHGDMLEILRKKQPKGILHCFSGSRDMALEMVEMGLYIGFGGVITFKNARNVHVAKKIAELRGLSEEEVLSLTAENARRVYAL